MLIFSNVFTTAVLMFHSLYSNCALLAEQAEKCRIDLDAALTKQEVAMGDMKRKLAELNVPEEDAKRFAKLEKRDKAFAVASLSDEEFFKEHFWKWVDDSAEENNYSAHCMGRGDCWYYCTDRLRRYTGYWECTLDNSIYYCDVCFVNSDTNEWKDTLAERPTLTDLIEKECSKFHETKAAEKARATNPNEWREINTTVNQCTMVGCDELVAHHLRGTEHLLCEAHYEKAIKESSNKYFDRFYGSIRIS